MATKRKKDKDEGPELENGSDDDSADDLAEDEFTVDHILHEKKINGEMRYLIKWYV
jgi:hypothetical protein